MEARIASFPSVGLRCRIPSYQAPPCIAGPGTPPDMRSFQGIGEILNRLFVAVHLSLPLFRGGYVIMEIIRIGDLNPIIRQILLNFGLACVALCHMFLDFCRNY